MTDDLEKRLADAEAEIARLQHQGSETFRAGLRYSRQSAEWQARAEAAEEALRALRERVAGLADEWEVDYPLSGPPFYVTDLRAVLAYAPAEATPPAEQRAEP